MKPEWDFYDLVKFCIAALYLTSLIMLLFAIGYLVLLIFS